MQTIAFIGQFVTFILLLAHKNQSFFFFLLLENLRTYTKKLVYVNHKKNHICTPLTPSFNFAFHNHVRKLSRKCPPFFGVKAVIQISNFFGGKR